MNKIKIHMFAQKYCKTCEYSYPTVGGWISCKHSTYRSLVAPSVSGSPLTLTIPCCKGKNYIKESEKHREVFEKQGYNLWFKDKKYG